MKSRTLLAAAAASCMLSCEAPALADTIDFGQWYNATLGNVLHGITVDGVTLTITGPGQGFSLLYEPASWNGSFPDGTAVLFDNYKSGPIKFQFDTPISSINDLAVEDNYYGPYTATLKAFSGATYIGEQRFSSATTSIPGTISAFDFSAPGITSLVLTTSNDGIGVGIGQANGSGGYSVPEPTTWALFLVGVAGLGAALRVRARSVIA